MILTESEVREFLAWSRDGYTARKRHLYAGGLYHRQVSMTTLNRARDWLNNISGWHFYPPRKVRVWHKYFPNFESRDYVVIDNPWIPCYLVPLEIDMSKVPEQTVRRFLVSRMTRQQRQLLKVDPEPEQSIRELERGQVYFLSQAEDSHYHPYHMPTPIFVLSKGERQSKIPKSVETFLSWDEMDSFPYHFVQGEFWCPRTSNEPRQYGKVVVFGTGDRLSPWAAFETLHRYCYGRMTKPVQAMFALLQATNALTIPTGVASMSVADSLKGCGLVKANVETSLGLAQSLGMVEPAAFIQARMVPDD